MMVEFGRLDEHPCRDLRLVLFAGEVFPIRHLRALVERWPHPSYWNLYGPTETNVCTAYELPRPFPADRREPFPIGRVCSHLRGLVLGEDGREARPGEEGELCIAGPSLLDGYWELPERTAAAFHVGADGTRWYRTGDVVVEEPDGNLRFLGRRDRMVKKRGYRIELGEIEACLYRHPAVREAATVAIEDEKKGVQIHAHLATQDGARLSIIKLKQFCSEHVPSYMIPDVFHFRDALPKTSTDKIDYQKLRAG
jgi:acyl-coenzyme A synthetase/AMP-(fatty) acid ligase